MKKYYLLFIGLIIVGCSDAPEPVSLQKELKPYDSVQKSCLAFAKDESVKMKFIQPECTNFLNSLKVTNDALKVKKGYRNDPRYFKAKNDYNAANKRIKKQHRHLNLVLKSKAYDAIDTDDLTTFTKIVNFPLLPMNIHYYNYMNKHYNTFKKNRKYNRFKSTYADKQYALGYTLVNKGRFTQGLNKLSLSAEMGNIKAARLCGNVYYDLYPEHSLSCYLKAVEDGDTESEYNVARLYEDDKESKKAFLWYKKAAKHGNYMAEYKMYEFYKEGEGTLQDSQKSQEWLNKSAKSGYPKAQYAYGMKLMAKNKNSEAIKYLRAAADKGEMNAFYPLGKLYFAKKEYKQSYKMLSQADANADSMYKLGYLKEHGKGTSRSYYSAYDFYKKSEKLGKKSARNDVYRMAKAKKRLKSKARKQEQHQAVVSQKQVKYNRERSRLASLEDERIRKHRANKAKEANRLKIQACGNEPTDATLRRSGTRVHLKGNVVHWLGKNAFVIKVNGEEYYIKDSGDEARVNKGDSVNIVAKTTGKREIVRGLKRSIFEEADESAIAKAYALNFTGVCPY